MTSSLSGKHKWTAIATILLAIGLIPVPAMTAGKVARSGSFRFEPMWGPYAVGLKVVEQYDASRTYRYAIDDLGKEYHGVRARPLQTLIWYPAVSGDRMRMTLADYVNLWATETSFEHPRMPFKEKQWLSSLGGSVSESLHASRDASPTEGRFPVVIYAPGASDMAWENLDLCEYLASFGYVVIAAPSLGEKGPTMPIDLSGANTQAKDISFLLTFSQTLPNTDMSAVAVVGDSWGGLAALFAAARDDRIKALVALDGSMRYYPGLVRTGDVHPEKLTLPLLYFMQGDYSLELRDLYGDPLVRDGPSVLNSWNHGDLVIVHMLGMPHAAMCSIWQRNEDLWQTWGKSAWQPGDYDREDSVVSYGWLARYTRAFLDAYIKHDAAASRLLKDSPSENGVPKHLVAVRYAAGSGAALSVEDFRAEIGRQGFDHLSNIYASFQARDKDFSLSESVIADWASELLSEDHPTEAIALFELNAKNHPESDRAYAHLGDAYRIAGLLDKAANSYRRALAKSPNESAVKKKLEELGGAP